MTKKQECERKWLLPIRDVFKCEIYWPFQLITLYSVGGTEGTGENWGAKRESCSSATVPIRNSTWTDLGSTPGLCDTICRGDNGDSWPTSEIQLGTSKNHVGIFHEVTFLKVSGLATHFLCPLWFSERTRIPKGNSNPGPWAKGTQMSAKGPGRGIVL